MILAIADGLAGVAAPGGIGLNHWLDIEAQIAFESEILSDEH